MRRSSEARNLEPELEPVDDGAMSLKELGVPGPLAREMEAIFKVRGQTSGGRVVGYRFVTPDGASHPLRLEE